MKKITAIVAFLLLMNSVQAQGTQVNGTPLLKHYFELKDALVNSDAATASVKISEAINVLNSELTLSAPLQKKLVAAGKDLEKQRNAFADLSLEMYTIVKTHKLSADTIYQEYCPMKKMYWLSKEPAIRNPYYGKAMLTCGSVTQIIKP